MIYLEWTQNYNIFYPTEINIYSLCIMVQNAMKNIYKLMTEKIYE